MEHTQMPVPGPQHEKLRALIGTWIGGEHLHPSPWDPVGGPAEGTVTNVRALDGFAVVQDYVQRRGGEVTYQGHGVFSWDLAEQKYKMHWWDSLGFPPNVFTGDFDDNILLLEFAGQQGHHRATFKMNGDTYEFSMEVSPDGNEWHPFMTGSYQRQE